VWRELLLFKSRSPDIVKRGVERRRGGEEDHMRKREKRSSWKEERWVRVADVVEEEVGICE
jgi:hypothetical protein